MTRGALPLFAACGLLGLAALSLPPARHEPWHLALGAVAIAGSVAMAAHGLRSPERTRWEYAAPLVFFGVIVVLRSTADAESGVAALLAVPVLWVALFGTRVQLGIAAVLTVVTFGLPLLLVGPPTFPLSDWRRAFIWVLVVTLVAPLVQRVVHQLTETTAAAHALGSQLEAVLHGAELHAIIGTGVDGTIEVFNRGAERMLGYPAEEAVGRMNLAAVHDPVETAALARRLGVEPGVAVFVDAARAGDGGRTCTYVRKDGSRLSVHLAATELRDREGTLTGFVGVARDATADLTARRVLEQAEARWRTLLDNLPGATVITLDQGLRITEVAGALRGRLAAGPGRRLGDILTPATAVLLEQAATRTFAGSATVTELTSLLVQREHQVVATLLPATGDVPEVMLVARDVSQERARERQLEVTRGRFERLFDAAPYGIAVVGLDGLVEEANPALGLLLGLDVSEIVGASAVHIPTQRRAGELGRHAVPDLFSPADAEHERVIRRSDGDDLRVVTHGVGLQDRDGSPDGMLVHVIDVSERHRYEQQLAHLADHDPLTGLPNRRRFDEALRAHLATTRRYGLRGAVLILDLDNFKHVNDTLGHAEGDKLLVSLSAALTARLRESDFVARLGGDEFAVLLPEADAESARRVAEDLVSTVRQHVRLLSGVRATITVSIGAVPVRRTDTTASELMSRADLTMYEAKELGRDGFVVRGDRYVSPRTPSWLVWSERIATAIRSDGLVLHAQPVLELATRRVRSAELLVRMVDEDGALIPPNRFLYVAERAGLVADLDSWVIGQAVADLARINAIDPGFGVEVNLSGLTVGNADYEQVLRDALATSGVDPANLVLEITETAAVQGIEAAREFAERVTALGCSFALDDFGAGFGSYYYLKHLLFDYVKIDGEFVTSCARNDTDRLILRSIVDIAHGLGKQAIAECVEDAEVIEVLTELGVDHAQGYEIGRPAPVADLLAKLQRTAAGRV